MKFRLLFNPEFYDDLEQAVEWYETQQPGLGTKFFQTVGKRTSELQTTALNFAIRYDDIRCFPLKRFPYMIHYRIDIENDLVKIEGLFHNSRSPQIWKNRTAT